MSSNYSSSKEKRESTEESDFDTRGALDYRTEAIASLNKQPLQIVEPIQVDIGAIQILGAFGEMTTQISAITNGESDLGNLPVASQAPLALNPLAAALAFDQIDVPAATQTVSSSASSSLHIDIAPLPSAQAALSVSDVNSVSSSAPAQTLSGAAAVVAAIAPASVQAASALNAVAAADALNPVDSSENITSIQPVQSVGPVSAVAQPNEISVTRVQSVQATTNVSALAALSVESVESTVSLPATTAVHAVESTAQPLRAVSSSMAIESTSSIQKADQPQKISSVSSISSIQPVEASSEVEELSVTSVQAIRPLPSTSSVSALSSVSTVSRTQGLSSIEAVESIDSEQSDPVSTVQKPRLSQALGPIAYDFADAQVEGIVTPARPSAAIPNASPAPSIVHPQIWPLPASHSPVIVAHTHANEQGERASSKPALQPDHLALRHPVNPTAPIHAVAETPKGEIFSPLQRAALPQASALLGLRLSSSSSLETQRNLQFLKSLDEEKARQEQDSIPVVIQPERLLAPKFHDHDVLQPLTLLAPPPPPPLPQDKPLTPSSPPVKPLKPSHPHDKPITPSRPPEKPLQPSHPHDKPITPSHPHDKPITPSRPPEKPLQPSHPHDKPLTPSHPHDKPITPSRPPQKPLQPSHPHDKPLTPSHPHDKPITPSRPPQKPLQPSHPHDKPITPSDPHDKPITPSRPPQKPLQPSHPHDKPLTPSHPHDKPITPSRPPQKPLQPSHPHDKPLTPSSPPVKPLTPSNKPMPEKPIGTVLDQVENMGYVEDAYGNVVGIKFEVQWTDSKGAVHDDWFFTCGDDTNDQADYIALIEDYLEFQETGKWDPKYDAALKRLLESGVYYCSNDQYIHVPIG